MKVLRLTGIRELGLEETPTPEPGQDETLLQVLACALCRTDAKMWDKGQRDLILPRVLGHEIYGVDESTGDRFVVWPGEACGRCRYCETDTGNLCRSMRILGFNKDGGLAEKVVVRRDSLIPVPKRLPGPVATLAEPLGCCLNALNQVHVELDAKVLVFGAGPVGLLMALAVRARGARPFLVEKEPAKLTLTRSFRERVSVSTPAAPISDQFDVTINAAPSLDTFSDALELLRPGGQFCIFSGFPSDEAVPAHLINDIH